ncbi:hypothetical protein CFC21_081774 [Triticum aestivum]|uniref:EXPERA domain-containing protein n=3 Tax=Triticum TaxID=4564 RepID=A0A9R0XSC4_TRITD|nr:sigma intracellular receptor 2-like [Triticum aestivum]KAF7077197.1 hypothetical protein CFC21_081774 [Triticum aestivum]VAI41943.1 unnamed protein product [Triticum turgidum subsp. durum]
MNAMGALSWAADAVVVIYSLTVAITAPLVVAQGILPRRLFPAPLVAFKLWYAAKFDDYLTAEPPSFFRGLNWLELIFQWPLNVANVYGILAGCPWAATTSLMAGVSTLTSMAAILGDILGSGRATKKLLLVYVPYVAFAVVAILRGLTSGSGTQAGSLASYAWKKII